MPTPWTLPQLDLHIENLSHLGVQLFFNQISPYDAMKKAVLASWKHLYGWNEHLTIQEAEVPLAVQCVKKITLTLRPMDGVAYTFGSDDGSEKQVHFSLKHIVNSHQGDTTEKKNTRVRDEILGVLVHEIVHCYQYNGKGKAPAGLIEGISDCVRLHEKLQPPHWKRVAPKGKHVPDPKRPNGPEKWVWDWNWDAGYERTAYFLDWIDTTWETWPQYTFRNTTSRPATSLTSTGKTSSPAAPSTTAIPANPLTSPSGPSPPLGKGLFFRALNARLEKSEWRPEVDLFLELTHWPREALWEKYCADMAPK